MRKIIITETFKYAYDGCIVKTIEKGSVLPENDQAAQHAWKEGRGYFDDVQVDPNIQNMNEGSGNDDLDDDDDSEGNDGSEEDEVQTPEKVKRNEGRGRKRRK